jgi:protein-S-isoprenylcysteine O-methyltransferase Ste14
MLDLWRRRPLALRVVAFTLLYPGTATVLVPWLLLSWSGDTLRLPLGALGAAGAIVLVLGLAVYAWCARDFAARGRGTGAPFDPPRALVVAGLYRVVRNPMYVGVVSIVLGEALLWRSWTLLAWAATLLAGFHLRVVTYEEPTLRRLFGDAFTRYCAAVPRWLPRPPRRVAPSERIEPDGDRA